MLSHRESGQKTRRRAMCHPLSSITLMYIRVSIHSTVYCTATPTLSFCANGCHVELLLGRRKCDPKQHTLLLLYSTVVAQVQYNNKQQKQRQAPDRCMVSLNNPYRAASLFTTTSKSRWRQRIHLACKAQDISTTPIFC